MKVLIFDASSLTSKSVAHEYIKEVLSFPGHYGKNLDALADCLSEMPGDVGVVMTGFEAAAEALGDYADGILECFVDTLGIKGRFMKV